MMSASAEWRRGWKLVLSASIGSGLTAVLPYALGLFCDPLGKQFGWSRLDILSAISITAIITGFGSPLVGKLIDLFGARPLALAGAVFISASSAALALTSGSIAVYWGLWIIVSIGFMFASPLVWTTAVASMFDRSKGLALSVTLCGVNLMGAISPPLAAYLIHVYGWRYAFAGLGLFMFLASVPVSLLFFYDARGRRNQVSKSTSPEVKSQPVDHPALGYGLSPRQALRTSNFWLIGSAFFIAGSMLCGLQAHFVPMLLDGGLKITLAASVMSLLNLTAILGRIGGGVMIDRWFAPRLAAGLMLLPGIASIILCVAAGSFLWAALAAILTGLALGAEVNMIAYLTARYFGMRHYGQIYGYLYSAFCLGLATGPISLGWFYNAFGNYRLALELMAGCYALSSIILLFCGRYPAQIAVEDTAVPLPA